MRQARLPKYLNVILTVNAVVLGGLLWTQVAGSSLGAPAAAQSQVIPPAFPNASAQRQEMIESLEQLRASVDAMNKTLSSGSIKVTVTNLSDLDTGDDDG